MTRPTHAVLYPAPGADPARDRVTLGRTRIVPIDDIGDAAATALDLVADGIGLVELCGGFSPVDRARISASVQGLARVSSITYGIESLDAAARFKAAYERGEAPKEAFVLLVADADAPGAHNGLEPFLSTPDIHPTTIVPVASEADGARAAKALADDGTLLIELYGGFSTQGIAAVIEAVAGRATVGAGSFALDAAC